MHSFATDQAEGLRRLFRRRSARLIAIAAGCRDVGRTSISINQAAALAAQGHRVLVIDENAGPGNVCAALRLTARRDLLDVMRGECAVEDALLAAAWDISVLPAAGAVQAVPHADRAARERLAGSLVQLSERFDFILIDAMCGTAGALFQDAGVARETLLVCSGGYAAITASYSLVKKLRGDSLRFRLLLNRVADERAARVIFDNLDRLARSRLGTPLEYLGSIARDEHLQRAAQMLQPVVTAFPSSPAARALARSAEALASSTVERDRPGSLDRILQLFRGRPLTLANAGV